jgi:ABC-2 type transport system permease protein
MSDTVSNASGARIFDRGYRRYDGERKGVRGAFFTLYLATLQRILGLRRGAKAKILPVLVIAISYLPAIVFIGLAAFFKNQLNEGIPDYFEYYGFVITAILLFVAFVSPEAVCPDRRYKILGVYLASPLSRLSYVLSKLAAVFTVLCLVTVGPVLLLAVARTLLDAGPSLKDLPILILRILGAGAGLSFFFATLSLAVSSLTDRKGFASAGFILLTIVTEIIGAVVGRNPGSRTLSEGVLLSTTTTPSIFAQQVYGRSRIADFGILPVFAAMLAMMAISLGVLVYRYRSLEVTR